MNEKWFVVPGDTQFFVARGGTVERPTHVHPIGFDSEREAARAMERLNAQERS